MRRMVRWGGLLALVSVFAACRDEAPAQGAARPVMDFDTASVRVASATDTTTLLVELAVTDKQRTMGLMERESLAENAGMLFLYETDQPAESGFWMFRTRIHLDIAYIDSVGTIGSIRQMEPCESPFAEACPNYPAGVPYRGTLEVSRDWFTRHNIRVGDRVMLEDVPRVQPEPVVAEG